jgi:uncharacterized protein YihD (DUF1040 family)
MRDPNRIDGIIERLRAVWKRRPHMRLGQLVANGAMFGLNGPTHLIEDDELISAIEEVHK